MIAWATGVYPDAPWKRHGGRVTDDNEHLADAVAIAHAGVQTPEFRKVMTMFKLAAA